MSKNRTEIDAEDSFDKLADRLALVEDGDDDRKCHAEGPDGAGA